MRTPQRRWSAGIGGIKLKVGQPDWHTDVARVDRGSRVPRRRRPADGRRQPAVGPGHRACGWAGSSRSSVWSGSRSRWTRTTPRATPNLARSLDTPIATGEMLASVAEHVRLIDAGAADIVQPDAPRIGGITQFLKLAASPSPSSWRSPRTSRWRSTATWRRRTRSSRGSSTSTGWTRCSTSTSRPATVGCGSPTGPGSASPSASRPHAWTDRHRGVRPASLSRS